MLHTIEKNYKRIDRELAEAGNPKPKYEQSAFMIIGTAYSMFRNVTAKDLEKEESSVNVPENVPEKRRNSLLLMIKEEPFITIPQLAKFCGVDEKTIKRDINQLKTLGRIERIGPDKGGYWKVNV